MNRYRQFLARRYQLWRQHRLRRRLFQLGAGPGVRSLSLDGTAPYLQIGGRIEVGENVMFRGYTQQTAITISPNAVLRIGADSFINQGANFAVTCGVTLGRRCLVGDDVSFFDTNYHEVDQGAGVLSSPIVIGDNVWFGYGAIVLPGTRIGDHSVVGAGAVVRGEFPARSLIAGVPARQVRTIQCAEDFVRI